MKPAKILVGVLGGAAVMTGFAVAGQFAGATLFAQLEKLPSSVVGVTTLYRYWVAYGHIVAIKKVLVACTALSVLVSAVPLLIPVILAMKANRPRELHGSARFANLQEIRKSGLVEERR
ncbi:hypothetical protein [Paraburkholderia susongensis]|uniref:Uncharacterized protein n=1 Tax=Paraburkholderia susongensis TaxID=1515439 RepID=A0A1X7M5T4_9BURK|nr:hypothetical protein [Paraburkholderia susongensis]SMG61558.1 hypothetical protein SAMN06265784_12322 [Paraburkholderia susongensis]